MTDTLAGPYQWHIGEIGRSAAEVTAGLPLGATSGSDIEVSFSSFAGHEIRAASVRGLLHRYRGAERQDSWSITTGPGNASLLIAVADGVGSYEQSRQASTLATALASKHWAQTEVPLTDLATTINAELSLTASAAKSSQGIGATTLTLVAVRPTSEEIGGARVEMVTVGDSPVWLLAGSEWTCLTAPNQGEDPFLAPTRALPAETVALRTFAAYVARGALFTMTDGVGNALLGDEAQQHLSRWWQDPPDPLVFAGQVSFARRSYIDDRTCVGIWIADSGA